MPRCDYKIRKLNNNIEAAKNKLEEILTSHGIEVLGRNYTLRELINLIPINGDT